MKLYKPEEQLKAAVKQHEQVLRDETTLQNTIPVRKHFQIKR